MELLICHFSATDSDTGQAYIYNPGDTCVAPLTQSHKSPIHEHDFLIQSMGALIHCPRYGESAKSQ